VLKSLYSAVGFLFIFLSANVLLAKPIPVRDVKVDVQGKTALEARDLALTRARQVAFTKLASEYPEYGISVNNGVPPDRILEGLVIDYEVVREKMSAVRYIGVFNFNFNDKALQRYMSGSPKFVRPGPDVVTDVADKVENNSPEGRLLIIPVYISPDSSFLWEETNPWNRYWVSQETKTKGKMNGRPFTVPLGDLRDIAGLTIEDAMTSKMQPLSLMMERYKGDVALILILKSLDDGMNSHELLVKAHTRTGVLEQSYEPIVLQGQKGVTPNDIFKSAVQKSIAMISGKGGVDLMAAVEPSQGDDSGEPGAASPSNFKAVVSFNNFQDWQSIRQALSNSEYIDEFEVLNLNRHQAEISVKSRIPAAALREKLAQVGVRLNQTGGKSRISNSNAQPTEADIIPQRVQSPFEAQPIDEEVEVIEDVEEATHNQPEVIE
jgi:hypothetical protein